MQQRLQQQQQNGAKNWWPFPKWLSPLLLLLQVTGSNVVHGGTGQSLTDRLLALWTNGEVDLNSHVHQEQQLGPTTSVDDDSLKKVLEFLGQKAKASRPSNEVPAAALAGLNALVSGTARKPRPIDLGRQSPANATLGYFDQLGIHDAQCRKRTICEVLTEPQASYGVFGELLDLVFGHERPSADTSTVLGGDVIYAEYYEAATSGRHMLDCSQLYGACATSYKEYIKLANM